MRPAIFLFDIDGTLISSDGAGRRAVERAFALVTGRRDACAGFSFAGMTDRAIVRKGLETCGRAAGEDAIDEVIAAYLALLGEEVRVALNYGLHPGVVEAVDRALARPASAVGLGTGNVAPGARIKLARVGLADRFAFGGFGSDAEDRAALLGIGAARGAARLGLPLAACRVVVIGDTPKDVEAAHAIGAEAIAVATGPYSVDALAASAPARVYGSLAAPGAVEAMLG